MAIHAMRLHPVPFELIKNGSKTIEIRINDEKRQAIQVGDEIVFTLRSENPETITREVMGLALFPSFKEAFLAYPPEAYGGKSADEYVLMSQYYSSEEEEERGVVAISLKTSA